MIIETDFPDHWKTRALTAYCGDGAVLCLLRLWAHCQVRKEYVFDYTPDVLEAVAGWNGEPGQFFDGLRLYRFIDTNGGEIEIHDFKKINPKLVANWKNGSKGGRPKTEETRPEPTANPAETHSKPNGNPMATERKPSGNPEKKPTRNPRETQTEPTANPNGDFKPTENPTKTQLKPNGNPDTTQTEPTANPTGTHRKPDSKDSKDSKDSIPPISPPLGDGKPNSPQRKSERMSNEVVRLFGELLPVECGNGLSANDAEKLCAKFSEFAAARIEMKKPFKTENGAKYHARQVRRALEAGFSAGEILGLFDRAIGKEWQDWIFEEDFLKKEAQGKSENNNSPRGRFTLPGAYGDVEL